MMAVVEGNEEIETVTVSNVLTRAGNEVKICKVNIDDLKNEKNYEIQLARGLRIVILNKNKFRWLIRILKTRIIKHTKL